MNIGFHLRRQILPHATILPRLLKHNLGTIAAFVIPFTLYVFTLAPTVYNLDSAELTTAAATGGLMRSTGYPLYLIIGWFWSHLPIGDVGYRMNLFSAVCGALTVALVERILRRLDVHGWATFAALGSLTLASYFWALSLIAEVYTLHTFLMVFLILLILRWGERPTPARLAAFGFVLGLSFGHHAATVLLLPGFASYILLTHPKAALAPRALFFTALTLVLGSSVYLYLPLRYIFSPSFNYAGQFDANGNFRPANLLKLPELLGLISGQTFQKLFYAYSAGELPPQVLDFIKQLSRAFMFVGLGPGLVGSVIIFYRDKSLAKMLLLMFFFHASFYIGYRVLDKDQMFLPNYVIWAIWVGVGCQAMLGWVERSYPNSPLHWEINLVRLVLAIGIVGVFAWNLPLVNLSRDRSARQRGETILHIVKSNALILGYWDTVPIVQYLQLVEGQRPDIKAVNRFFITSQDMYRFVRRQVCLRPIYIDAVPDGYEAVFSVKYFDPLFQLTLRQGCPHELR